MSTNNTRRRKAKKQPAAQDDHLKRIAEAAVAAWQLCKDAQDWPGVVDTMLMTEWRGKQIAWPGFEGECYSIFAIDDAGVVSHEDLPGEVALALPWRKYEFSPPCQVFTAPTACMISEAVESSH